MEKSCESLNSKCLALKSQLEPAVDTALVFSVYFTADHIIIYILINYQYQGPYQVLDT